MGMASAGDTRYAGMDQGMSLGLALDLGGSATRALDGRGLPPLLGSHAVADDGFARVCPETRARHWSEH